MQWLANLLPQPFEASLEQQFWQEYNKELMPMRRRSLWLGHVIWLSFILWDVLVAYYSAEYAKSQMMITSVRIIVFFIYIITYWLLFHKKLLSDLPWQATSSMIISSSEMFLALIALNIVSPKPYDDLYFIPGFIVCILFFFTIFIYPTRILWFQLVIFWISGICLFYFNQLKVEMPSSEILIKTITQGALFFIALVTIFISGWYIEYIYRRQFQANQELKNNRNELVRLNASLQQHIHSMEKLQEQIKQQAEHRTKDMAQFIATAVHDLRQPAQAIVTSVHLLGKTLVQHPSYVAQQASQVAIQASKVLEGLLSDIMNVARLESGAIIPQMQHFSILEILHRVILIYAEDAQNKPISVKILKTLPTSSEQWVYSDPQFIERIISNIVNNGIKYARKSSSTSYVHLNLIHTTSRLGIVIKDNGIGIAQNDLEQKTIFRPFTQINNHLPQMEKGVGLGLTIVRGMLDLLPQHDLEVQSTLNEGSTFTLWIPFGIPSTQKLLIERHPHDLDRLRLLYAILVEDDPFVTQSMTMLLHHLGIQHEVCDQYDDFVRLVATIEREPDLIITDFRLPHGCTGWDVIQLADETFGYLPAIMITGETQWIQPDTQQRPITLLTKPVGGQVLSDTIFNITSKEHKKNIISENSIFKKEKPIIK